MKVIVSKILSALGMAFGVAAFFVYLFGSAIYIPKKIAENEHMEIDLSGIGLFYVINFENECISAVFDCSVLNLVDFGDKIAEDSEYDEIIQELMSQTGEDNEYYDIVQELISLTDEFIRVHGSVEFIVSETTSDVKVKMEAAFVDDELPERCNAFIERCEEEGLSKYLTVTVSDLKLKTDWSVSLPVICLIISVIIGGIMTFLDDGNKIRAIIFNCIAVVFAVSGAIMMPVTALSSASKMITSLSVKNTAFADMYFALGTGTILGCILAFLSSVLFVVIPIIKIKSRKNK